MRIGFFQHGAVPAENVAEYISARSGEAVNFRNAHYFDDRDDEVFDIVVVDEGANTESIRAHYSDVEVLTVEEYLTRDPNAAPAPAPAAPGLNADAPRRGRAGGRRNGG